MCKNNDIQTLIGGLKERQEPILKKCEKKLKEKEEKATHLLAISRKEFRNKVSSLKVVN